MVTRPLLASIVLAASVAVLAVAGCGAPERPTGVAPPQESSVATTTASKCKGASSAAVRVRKLRRLGRDVARVRRLAAPLTKRTLDGSAALSRAVDVFLLHVADRDMPAHARSRMIDRAGAAVSPVCEQCFQALEAARPLAGGAKLACD